MAASNAEGKIKPIDKTAVHRICSGQVVLDLATAVKELVENSLDAGATSIDIRLRDHGSELIEVADNGTGVSPDNYQGLTLKYHTSKISKFTDLQSLSSFGFRGEALSSLCALAKLSIITRTEKEPIAVRLEYDHSGVIISQENVARAVGTTVSVAKLFSPLPVRFKEFRRENNLRREYGRLLSVLQAYALVAKGVRIICSHQAGKGGRTVVVQTQGNKSMRENLVTVFGTKTAACMESLHLIVSDTCSVEGFVSKPGAGCGRPSGDRQFFYVNGRPVDLPKVAKLLNELYRSFNSLQYPMAVLNFILPTTAYDVNVTPNKRKLFLHSELELLAALRGSLEKVYTPTKYTYTVNNVESGRLPGKGPSSEKTPGKTSPVEFDAPTEECSEEEDDEEAKGEGVPPTSRGAVQTETKSASGKGPLSLLSFQHKATNPSSEKKPKGTCETASRGKTLPNVQSERKIQATLVPCTARAKRSVEEESHGVLTEVPLLKRWKQLIHTKRVEEEDEDEKEEVHEVHDMEGEVSNLPDGSGAHTSAECSNVSPTEEDDVILPPVGENDQAPIANNRAAAQVRKMAPCSTGKSGKRSTLRPSAESEVDKRSVDKPVRRVVEARQCMAPDACCAEPMDANGDDVNQMQGEGLRDSFDCATEVDCERGGNWGEEPVLENVKKGSRAQQERIRTLIDSNNNNREADAGTKVAETEQTAMRPPKQRQVIEFNMEQMLEGMKFMEVQAKSQSLKPKPRKKR